MELGSVLARSPEKASPQTDGDLPFVGLDAIAPHSMHIAETVPFGTMRSLGSRFREGDVLYGRLRPYLNKVWSADRDGACSGELLVLRTTDKLDPRFLAYRLHGREFVDYASHAVTGDRPRLDFKQLAAFRTALPPLETQRRIVARIDELFSELDDGEGELARARADLETYRKALLKAAVIGELTADWREANLANEIAQVFLDGIGAPHTTKRARGSSIAPLDGDTAELIELPDTWLWTRIGKLGIVTGGVTKNAKRAALGITLPYLRVANVGAGRLDLARIESIGLTPGEVDRVKLVKGDLLIVEGNGSIDQIGRSAVWNGQIDPCVHQNHLIKVRFGDQRLAQWVQLWLRSPHGRHELEAKASSTSGLHTLSISKVESVRCPLPPSSELTRLLEITQDTLAFGETAEHDTAELGDNSATLRQSILAAAFRGELVQ